MRTTYFPEKLKAEVTLKTGALLVDLNGIPTKTFTLLALIGAISLCKTKRNPQQALKEIRKGNFTGRPSKPANPDIVVLSQVLSITTEQASVLWSKMDKKKKKDLRKTNFWKKSRSDLLEVNEEDVINLLT